MSLKAIYDIDVDDTKFRKFKELFDKYQAALAKLPKDWAQVAAGVGATKSSFEQLAKNAQRQSAADRSRADNEKSVNAIARSTAVVWTGVIETVSTVDKHLMHATGSLLKWSTLTATFSGLLGGGTLFGIDRLAASVSAHRKSALGLGISYGQQGAFNTNYSRLIDSQSLLSNVAGAKYDVTSPAYTTLLAAGVPRGTLQGGNAADISSDFLGRLDKLFPKGMDRGLIGPTAHAYGIDNVMSMRDLIAFVSASPEERRSIAERYAQDAKTMNLTDEAQRKWQDFTTAMGRAAGRIEATLAEKLADIEPGLEKVSQAFIDVVTALADKGVIKQWVTGLADGLETFAGYVKTDEFKTGVADFTKWVADAARGVWDFLKEVAPDMPALKGFGASTKSTFGDLSDVHFGQASVRATGGWWTAERQQHAIQTLTAGGLSPLGAAALVSRWANVESPGGPGSVNPRSGAFGIGQWLGGRQSGIAGDTDFDDQLAYALRELHSSEFRSYSHLNAATDPRDAAIGASMYERAEGYDPATGTDNYTGRTAAGIRWNANTPTVVVRSNTGNNPVLSNALVANPYTAVVGP